jgi:TonB-dependent SusC/RagA subfamily outer membrane receptor
MRKVLAVGTLCIVTACSAERATSPEPASTSALAQCQQSAEECARPMLIVDGKVSSLTVLDLKGIDLESVEVIKGAVATRFYGADARNGVIIITTKRRD